MLAVRLLNLVEALGDQKGSNAVTGHEGEAGFEEIQAAERRELVQHHQQTVALRVICGLIQPLRQATPDLVEEDRKSVMVGKSVPCSVGRGGRVLHKKKN